MGDLDGRLRARDDGGQDALPLPAREDVRQLLEDARGTRLRAVHGSTAVGLQCGHGVITLSLGDADEIREQDRDEERRHQMDAPDPEGDRDESHDRRDCREAEPSGEAHDPVVWMDAESKRRGIKQNYEFVVRSIDPERKVVQGLYNYRIPYDLLVMVPPHRPAQVLLDSGLADTETGIRVDYDTLETKWENVFAIGDCADMPASKAGGVAHQEADVLAHNLAVELTGKGRPVDLWLHTI